MSRITNLTALFIVLSVNGFASRYFIALDVNKPQLQSKILNIKNNKVLKNVEGVIVDLDETKLENVQLLQDLSKSAKVIKERFFKYPRLRLSEYSESKTVQDTKLQSEHNISSHKLIQPGLPWGIAAIHAPEVWKMGEKGAHSKVVILDSGIDRDHEALKKNFFKGKNFIQEPNPGPYEYYDNDGHGTHVAGTIAGRELLSGFSGVAPHAFLLAGRVCGVENCSSLAIIEGIDWAITEKADVVNLSLGGKEITPEEIDVIDKAIKHQVVIVAASGNDGSSEIEYPARLPDVISVGAIDQNMDRAVFSQYGPGLTIAAPGVDVVSTVPTGGAVALELQVQTSRGLIDIKAEMLQGSGFVNQLQQNIVYSGLGYKHEFKAAVRGKIALIKRGELTFEEKVNNAIAAGASGVIVFNSEQDDFGGVITEQKPVSIPAVLIGRGQGELIASELSNKNTVKAILKMTKTSFDAYDGTSMATPHVTGVVALLKSLNKKLTVDQVRHIITKTATSPLTSTQNELGAGIINAETAIMESLKY